MMDLKKLAKREKSIEKRIRNVEKIEKELGKRIKLLEKKLDFGKFLKTVKKKTLKATYKVKTMKRAKKR